MVRLRAFGQILATKTASALRNGQFYSLFLFLFSLNALFIIENDFNVSRISGGKIVIDVIIFHKRNKKITLRSN